MTNPISDVKNPMDVTGLNVIVTGGCSGIGWGITLAFAQRGANVAILDCDVQSGEKAVTELTQYGGKYVYIACNIADSQSTLQAAGAARSALGPIDVLVNCAGITAVKPFLDMDKELSEFRKVIDVDLIGTANMTYAVGNIMRNDKRGGLIINISSSSAVRCSGSRELPMTGYVASKAAVNHLTTSWAIEFAEHNIRVNCIMPGPTKSKMDDNLTPEYLERIANSILTRRQGHGMEIGALCVFFASPEGSHLDGVVMPHDGGFNCIN
ncbi:SDR family oxidoreductase [Dehalobacter sp. DCM]|uniref:SDR family NAD(P)-dependent oxidoreductase n=1 Tax=Dehalobacter sp. DCM TaxID=2907827 RepID=UPI003081D4BE|nr:SDR family oxidoreductase [Dehalobacter sp. DCM]